MPRNLGHRPNVDRCDIQLRNGRIIRNIDPKGWRWKAWPTGQCDWDICEWREAGK